MTEELSSDQSGVSANAADTPTTAPVWQPIEYATVDPKTTTYIDVRSITTYRWLPYKKDGQRQMGKSGRWQRAEGPHGKWVNDDLPKVGDFKPNYPVSLAPAQ